MKKILLLIATLCLGMALNAQSRAIFTCDSKEAAISNADNLLRDAKRRFVLRDTFSYNQTRFVAEYTEVEPSETPCRVRMVFQKQIRGGNAALEIEGRVEYELADAYGRFLDLFPIWKQYVQPEADMEAIAKQERTDMLKLESENGLYNERFRFYKPTNETNWHFTRIVTLK